MNPAKSFDHLDPKLKETYARVMGTDTSGASSTASPTSPVTNTSTTFPENTTLTSASPDFSPLSQPAPLEPQETSPATSSFFSNPTPSATEPQPSAENTRNASNESPVPPTPVTPYTAPESFVTAQNQNTPSSEAFTQPLPSPTESIQAPHEASALVRVLYIVGSVVFFLIYTVFWMKVFGIPIPFLPF